MLATNAEAAPQSEPQCNGPANFAAQGGAKVIPRITEHIRAWRAAWSILGDTIPPRDPKDDDDDDEDEDEEDEDRPDDPAVIREPDDDE